MNELKDRYEKLKALVKDRRTEFEALCRFA